MSKPAVDLVRQVYEAWNADGLDALRPWLSEAVELQDAPELPDSGTWRGRDEVLGRLSDVAASISRGPVELRGVRSVGDEVLVAMVWQTGGAPHGEPIGEVFHLVRVSGEEIARMRVFLDEAAALQA